MNLSGILVLCASCASSFLFGQSFEIAAPLKQRTLPSDTDVVWTEDPGARKLNSSTYYSQDGQIKIRNASRPINFESEAGQLIPIDATLKLQANGTWSATQQPHPTHLDPDGSVRLTSGEGQPMRFGKDVMIGDLAYNSTFSVVDNHARFEAFNGLTRHLLFRENSVKSAYELSSAPLSNTNLVISESIELPSGYTLEFEPETGKMEPHGWTGNIVIKNARGEQQAKLRAPVCFDQSQQIIMAGYTFVKIYDVYRLATTVPASWLLDPERSYPVIIDPPVTGPTTTWTGGAMPSCLTPSYNVDSILVTIPGGISVTQLNVTASFYADPWTTAIMADGRMFFSTSCDDSQVFSITGNPGNSAGTAYLDYYDLHNPLTCCFPESCNDQTFYLSYHLQRVVLGAGCNTTYIRYDPVTTSWPFEAVVIGKTPESFSAQWSVPSAAICSNNCNISGTAYVYYGVPPYTFVHPWSNDTIVTGVNVGCSAGATNYAFQLDIPNCPSYCDENFTSLDVPPPTITDACGSVVAGLPTRVVPIKTTPQVTATNDSDICSGDAFSAILTPCVSGATVNWSGNWQSGNGSLIVDTLFASSPEFTDTVQYLVSAEMNGCYSDTISTSVSVHPPPVANFTYAPDLNVVSIEAQFTDESNFHDAAGAAWMWEMGDGINYFDANHAHTYSEPGDYQICLWVTDDQGCADSTCQIIQVVPAEVQRPNVITANNDGVNDFLAFNYLDFYPDNELYIFNRWGNEVFYAKNYKNDWNGADATEGTYFFRLIIHETGEDQQGYFQLIR